MSFVFVTVNLRMKKIFSFKYFKKEASMVTFVLENGAQVMVAFKPFQILVYINGEVVVGLNSHHLLKFEHYRKKVYFSVNFLFKSLSNC